MAMGLLLRRRPGLRSEDARKHVTMRAAVLGTPISHSLSPVLHRAAYSALGLDWTYDAIEVGEDELPGFIDGCGPEWRGLSLTMPLKTAILPLLDTVTDLGASVGAVNTVVFAGGGRHGHNTDVAGMRRAITEASDKPTQPATATILGGGATARSALAAVAALGVSDVHLSLRSPARAGALVDLANEMSVAVHPHSWSEARHHLDSDVVIATTPPGTVDDLADAVTSVHGVLLDVAYGTAKSALVDAWQRAGGAAADGRDLLLWQAVDQVALMTGLDAPVDAMRSALLGVGQR